MTTTTLNNNGPNNNRPNNNRPDRHEPLTANAPTLMVSESLSVSDIQDWLAEQIGSQLGISSDDVDTHTPFHSYGLESAQAMAMATVGKQRFGIEISPLVIWNCPTIETLSEYIAKELSAEEHFEV